jgi:hypothetical protein
VNPHMTLTFPSYHRMGADFARPELDNAAVKNEPMLFNATLAFAYEQGGPITRSFIAAFEKENPEIDLASCLIDTRVHMLMPNFWPCIPGWHHDDVERDFTGQPEYVVAPGEFNVSQHCIGLVNGDLAPTEFASGYASMSDPRQHAVVYGAWTKEVDSQVSTGRLRTSSAPSGKLVYFNNLSFHRGTQAVGTGWRWFGRISWNSKRVPTNEVRTQVQVYMSTPEAGW